MSPAGDAVLRHLKHRDASVREKSAWALSKLAVPQAIEHAGQIGSSVVGRHGTSFIVFAS